MLITVCITNHNYERFVERAIQTALDQDHDELEVVVVDDGSTDRSVDVLRRYEDRISVVSKPNGGQASAMNAGFAASHGDVVMFLDADDELAPGALRRVAEVFDAAPETAKVALRMRMIDAEGAPLGALEPAAGWSLPVGDLSTHVVRRRSYVWPASSGNAYRRSVLAEVLPIPEDGFRVEADLYLATLVPLCGAVAAIDEPLVGYRIHGTNSYAGGDLDGAFFRRKLQRIDAVHEALASWMSERGRGSLAPVERVSDPAYVSYRLASLLLDPDAHPYPTDSRRRLAARGAVLAARHPGHPMSARVRRSLWFLLVMVAPRRVDGWLLSVRFG
ncbi:MAG: glycosyltransferase [Acidimicrobiales bacterium]|nr:glycosyltransferase [Acidimicrobiales bacterium]